MRNLPAIACAVLLLAPIHAEEPTIAASELPQPVQAAIYRQEPKAVIIAAEKVTRSGETLYHVRFKTLATIREAVVTPDGMVKETSQAK